MRSASTERVSSVAELSKVAQERAIRGQPTLAARVQAVPVGGSPALPRVMARPMIGQAAPAAAAPAASAAQSTTISMDEAKTILAGLTETLRLADNARTTGWRCTGVDDATFYKGRVLRDRLANFVSFPPQGGGGFQISRDETDVADKILSCSNEATASSPNKNAYIVLGVIVVGAAIFLSVV